MWSALACCIVLLADSPELQKMLDTMGQYVEEWKFGTNASIIKTMHGCGGNQ